MTESEAAAKIRDALVSVAEDLPFGSELRALALRSSACWATIAEHQARREGAVAVLNRCSLKVVG